MNWEVDDAQDGTVRWNESCGIFYRVVQCTRAYRGQCQSRGGVVKVNLPFVSLL